VSINSSLKSKKIYPRFEFRLRANRFVTVSFVAEILVKTLSVTCNIIFEYVKLIDKFIDAYKYMVLKLAFPLVFLGLQ
jgi:hypothetical protein